MEEWLLKHRRMAVVITALAFLLLLVLRHFLFASYDVNGEYDWAANIRSVLDALIAAIVVSLFVSFALWWLRPPSDRIPPGFEIPAIEISRTLERSTAATDEWEYIGHTARYVRTRIIPDLVEHSNRENKPCRIRIVILDPDIATLCEQYANYRNRSRSNELFNSEWTCNKVRAELLASIIRILQSHTANNYVSCEIGLRAFLSQYRTDRTREIALVTQEDPQEPAYKYVRGSRFYEHIKRENELIWEQSRKLDLASVSAQTANDRLKLKAALILWVPSLSNDETLLEQAFRIVNNDKSPYA
ncbi:MAG: hypothetical protein AAFW81_07580 [Pseudomonadota bacterium]